MCRARAKSDRAHTAMEMVAIGVDMREVPVPFEAPRGDRQHCSFARCS
jgi:hypothetical protein